MKSKIFVLSLISTLALAASLQASADIRRGTKEVKGTGGERITLDYGITAEGYKPTYFAAIRKVRVELGRALRYDGSPLAVVVVLASQSPYGGGQRVIQVPCQDFTKGVCEVAAPNYNTSDETSLGSVRIGHYPRESENDVHATVVFEGRPIADSYDGKSYFVLSNF